MNTRKFGENPDHQNEQLDLSLGLYLGNPCSQSPKPRIPTGENPAMKMYKCKFCTRKFCSSQALGGHQNSHRKERNAVKKYCQFTINHHSDHLLDDAASTPRRDHGDQTGFARFTENGSAGYKRGSVQAEAGVDLNYSNPQVVAMNRCDPDSLDLNLKL